MENTKTGDHLTLTFFQFGRNIKQISQLNRNYQELPDIHSQRLLPIYLLWSKLICKKQIVKKIVTDKRTQWYHYTIEISKQFLYGNFRIYGEMLIEPEPNNL